jgi:hypothetical protein
LTGFLLFGGGALALADDDAAPASPPHGDQQPDQLALPEGALVIDAFLEANLSKSQSFKPVSLSPDIWYGATDELTLGLVHSSVGATGFLGGVGDSLCLSGKSNGCAHFYQDVGLDARYRLVAPFVIDAGLFVRNFDPFWLAAKVGVGGRWLFDKVTLEVNPSLFFGFTHRDPFNKDSFNLPITVSYEVMDKLDLSLQSGAQLQLENTSDNYRVPASLAARYQFTPRLGAGLAFTLPYLIGPSAAPHGFDVRTLMLGGSYAL